MLMRQAHEHASPEELERFTSKESHRPGKSDGDWDDGQDTWDGWDDDNEAALNRSAIYQDSTSPTRRMVQSQFSTIRDSSEPIDLSSDLSVKNPGEESLVSMGGENSFKLAEGDSNPPSDMAEVQIDINSVGDDGWGDEDGWDVDENVWGGNDEAEAEHREGGD